MVGTPQEMSLPPKAKRNWLVLGSRGQLGTELIQMLMRSGEEVVGWDRRDFDLTDITSFENGFKSVKPTIVVNCAAWTNVDGAEDDPDAAMMINGAAVEKIGQLLSNYETSFFHISTDYVFDGLSDLPYAEDATPNPQTSYGCSKLAGETAILAHLPNSGFIIRTAWLYGSYGKNFAKTILKKLSDSDMIYVVNDQIGQPTHTLDVAEQIFALAIGPTPPGIYHATNSGSATWFDFAQELAILSGAGADQIKSIPSSGFPQKAKRPKFSVLSQYKSEAIGIPRMQSWQSALKSAMPDLLTSIAPKSL